MRKFFFLIFSIFLFSCPTNRVPTITLLNGLSSPINIFINEPFDLYTNLQAVDYDGKIIEDIKLLSGAYDVTTANEYVLKYQAIGRYGSKEFEVKVIVNDKKIVYDSVRPVITLKKENEIYELIYIPSNFKEFKDPGFEVYDEGDGIIPNDKVIIEYFKLTSDNKREKIDKIDLEKNDINIAKKTGIYFITYNVLDSAGNSAKEKERIINVVVKNTIGENTQSPKIEIISSNNVIKADKSLDSDAKIRNHFNQIKVTLKCYKNKNTETNSISVSDEDFKSASSATIEKDGVIINRSPLPDFSVPGEYTVYYTLRVPVVLNINNNQYQCYNEAITKREIKVADQEKPIITLYGDGIDWTNNSDFFHISLKEKFFDPAGQVVDQFDRYLQWDSVIKTIYYVRSEDWKNNLNEDIINKRVVDSLPESTSNAKIGDYYVVQYDVKDSSNNEAEKKYRKLQIVESLPPKIIIPQSLARIGFYSSDKFVFPAITATTGSGEPLKLVKNENLFYDFKIEDSIIEEKDLGRQIDKIVTLKIRVENGGKKDEAEISIYVYGKVNVTSNIENDITEGSFELAWKKQENVNGYKVYENYLNNRYKLIKDIKDKDQVSELFTIKQGVTFYTIIPYFDNEYSPEIDSVGNFSEATVVKVSKSLPKVTNLVVSNKEFYDRISLNWDDVVGATGYYVFRAEQQHIAQMKNDNQTNSEIVISEWISSNPPPYDNYYVVVPYFDKSDYGWITTENDRVVDDLFVKYDDSDIKLGRRNLTDIEFVREVYTEILLGQSQFTLTPAWNQYIDTSRSEIIFKRKWANDKWSNVTTRNGLYDYIEFNNFSSLNRVKLNGALCYIYLFDETYAISNRGDYNVVTTVLKNSDAINTTKREGWLEVSGTYNGEIFIHALLDDPFVNALNNSNVNTKRNLTKILGETKEYYYNRILSDCDERDAVGGCPSKWFTSTGKRYPSDGDEFMYKNLIKFYENDQPTVSHKDKAFSIKRDGKTTEISYEDIKLNF